MFKLNKIYRHNEITRIPIKIENNYVHYILDQENPIVTKRKLSEKVKEIFNEDEIIGTLTELEVKKILRKIPKNTIQRKTKSTGRYLLDKLLN
jgi:hypothetical protein